MCEYEKPSVSSIVDSMINHVRAIQVEEHKLQRFHEYEYNTMRVNQPFFNGLRSLENHLHMLVNCNNEQKRKEEKER